MKYSLLIISIIVGFGCQSTETPNTDSKEAATGKESVETTTIVEETEVQPIIEDVEKLVNLMETMVPEGYILHEEQGKADILATDLDDDGREDYVVAFISESFEFARIGIFMYDTKGNLVLQSQSKDLPVLSFEHEHDQFTVKNRVLSFHHNAMRNEMETKFRYEKKYDDLMMIGHELIIYGNAVNDGSGTISVNYLTGVRIKKLNEFNSETEKLEPLPEERIAFDKPLISLSEFDEEALFSVW